MQVESLHIDDVFINILFRHWRKNEISGEKFETEKAKDEADHGSLHDKISGIISSLQYNKAFIKRILRSNLKVTTNSIALQETFCQIGLKSCMIGLNFSGPVTQSWYLQVDRWRYFMNKQAWIDKNLHLDKAFPTYRSTIDPIPKTVATALNFERTCETLKTGFYFLPWAFKVKTNQQQTDKNTDKVDEWMNRLNPITTPNQTSFPLIVEEILILNVTWSLIWILIESLSFLNETLSGCLIVKNGFLISMMTMMKCCHCVAFFYWEGIETLISSDYRKTQTNKNLDVPN